MKERTNIFLTVFFSAILLGFVLSGPDIFNKYEGLSKVENVDVSKDRLSVATLCYRLDMNISDSQSEALQNELYDREVKRPQTHELVEKAADRKINRVEIHSVKNNTYYADLIIGRGLTQKRIDVRPSDGVLIASSNDLPVMINENLVREKGVNQCLGGSIEI
ncbi:MAG: bifunctional nuclease domain-containing protein [Candidatus Nanohaloarchaea archaeon]